MPAPHLRNPRSLSRPQNDGFVPEIELKLSNLYRKPRLSTYESERKRVRDWGQLECQRHICEIQGATILHRKSKAPETKYQRPETRDQRSYRGTSLTRKRFLLGPYRRPTPRVLGGPKGQLECQRHICEIQGESFLMSRYIYLSVYLSVCLSICLSSIYLYIHIYIYLYVHLSFCLSIYLSIYLCLYLYLHLFTSLYLYRPCPTEVTRLDGHRVHATRVPCSAATPTPLGLP